MSFVKLPFAQALSQNFKRQGLRNFTSTSPFVVSSGVKSPLLGKESKYAQVYHRSIQDPEGFWADQVNNVQWYTLLADSYFQVQETNTNFRFFAKTNVFLVQRFESKSSSNKIGGLINNCYNAVDFHVENGKANTTAIIYDSPVTVRILHAFEN